MKEKLIGDLITILLGVSLGSAMALIEERWFRGGRP